MLKKSNEIADILYNTNNQINSVQNLTFIYNAKAL